MSLVDSFLLLLLLRLLRWMHVEVSVYVYVYAVCVYACENECTHACVYVVSMYVCTQHLISILQPRCEGCGFIPLEPYMRMLLNRCSHRRGSKWPARSRT